MLTLPIDTPHMLMQILDTLPAYVFLKNPQGHYLCCNQHFASLVGLKNPADIVGKTDYDLPWKVPGDQADFFRACDQNVLQGEPVIAQEEVLIVPNHPPQIVVVHKHALYDADQQPIALLAWAIDVTQQRQFQQQFKQIILKPIRHPYRDARVLILEHESLLGLTLQFHLQSLGCEFICVKTAQQALEQLANNTYELVFIALDLSDGTVANQNLGTPKPQDAAPQSSSKHKILKENSGLQPFPDTNALKTEPSHAVAMQLSQHIQALPLEKPLPLIALGNRVDKACRQACFQAGFKAVFVKPILFPRLERLITQYGRLINDRRAT